MYVIQDLWCLSTYILFKEILEDKIWYEENDITAKFII